ncbi:MAG: thioredoxin domain-containing protein [Phycisphaeraceae bacterium]|nr:MAG: thioredoxin domain-containing protein [Phycisphaeraceae bacterium]
MPTPTARRPIHTRTPPKPVARAAWAVWVTGVVGLAVALTASAALAARAVVVDFSPPGCGPSSPCEKAASSPWGTVPVLGVPTSIVGVAVFLGLVILWVPARRHAWPRGWLVLPGLGAAASIALLMVMARDGLPCAYCIAAHAGNLVFTACAVIHSAGGLVTRRAIAGPVIAAGVATAMITAAGLTSLSRQAAERRELARAEQAEADLGKIRSADRSGPIDPLAGRYPRGETGPSVVVFTAYQCAQCRTFEPRLLALKGCRVTIRQFPFCRPCNPHVTQDLHPGGCRAAAAVEAAGLVHGPGTFWAAHAWVFERAGVFSDAEFAGFLTSRGLDAASVLSAMPSAAVQANLLADTGLANQMGLVRTPTVFIDGVEVRGWDLPGVLERAIEAARAAPPTEAPAVPSALSRVIDEWLAQPVVTIPPDPSPRVRGVPLGRPAAADVVIFGDYQNPETARLDAFLTGELSRRDDLRVTFRHFPFDTKCNPAVTRSASPVACVMHRGAEAAAILAGDRGFWDAHGWLLANARVFSEGAFRIFLEDRLGIDEARVKAAMNYPSARNAVAQDAAAGGTLPLREVPAVIVNNRVVPRWIHGGEIVLGVILDAAGSTPRAPAAPPPAGPTLR